MLRYFERDDAPTPLHALASPLVDAIHAEARDLYEAVMVILSSDVVYLVAENDPMALQQLARAANQVIVVTFREITAWNGQKYVYEPEVRLDTRDNDFGARIAALNLHRVISLVERYPADDV